MRRSSRMKKSEGGSISDKIILYTLIGIAVLALIVFAILMYSKNINDEVKDSTMTLEQMAKASENEDETQSTGTEIGKSVNEAKEENTTNSTNSLNTVNNSNTVDTDNTLNTNNIQNTTTNTTQDTTNETSANATNNNNESQTKETKKELSFQKPVEGDIVREYAKDNLIYSNTLEEWTTHLGIDIKADKTTVVKSAEAGTVKSIKNDPRYGLTVVVEHADNFQTIYSNLLTSEFVVEGETIEKGQAIGTVGNTAVFEITDEPHLHFEILKDNVQVDPSIYIK